MLGFIPAFQFSADPAINPQVNPYVSMPAGQYQAGVYYTQPAYAAVAPFVGPPRTCDTANLQGPSGLGYWIAEKVPAVFNNPGDGLAKAATLAGLGVAKTAWVPSVYTELGGITETVANHKWTLLALAAASAAVGYYTTKGRRNKRRSKPLRGSSEKGWYAEGYNYPRGNRNRRMKTYAGPFASKAQAAKALGPPWYTETSWRTNAP